MQLKIALVCSLVKKVEFMFWQYNFENDSENLTLNVLNESLMCQCKVTERLLCNSTVQCKDAGFVYESLRNEMNRVIWDFCFHETNLSKKGLRIKSTIQIRIRKDSDSRISIFKDLFRAIVLGIRKDS